MFKGLVLILETSTFNYWSFHFYNTCLLNWIFLVICHSLQLTGVQEDNLNLMLADQWKSCLVCLYYYGHAMVALREDRWRIPLCFEERVRCSLIKVDSLRNYHTAVDLLSVLVMMHSVLHIESCKTTDPAVAKKSFLSGFWRGQISCRV